MAEIRVLQIIKGLDIGGINGGSDKFVIDLSEQLISLGCKVDLCVFFETDTECEKTWFELAQSKGLNPFFASKWIGDNKFPNYIRGAKTLLKFEDHNHHQVLHSHFHLGTYVALYVKRKYKTPVVLRTSHNIREWENGVLGKVKEGITDYIYTRGLDSEAGVSQAIVDHLSGLFFRSLQKKKPILIHNGMLMPRADKSNSVFNINQKVSTIGSVGRLTEQKGYSCLLAAMPGVLEHHPEIRLVLLGDGELRSDLKAQVWQLGVNNNILFAGLVDNVQERLHGFDLFVSSSLWEGLPTVIMEAMAVGLPVIATDIPGTREMISDGINGRLVPPGDPIALANAINTMIENPQMRQNLSEAGKETVKQYSIEEIAKRYLELYEALMARSEKKV